MCQFLSASVGFNSAVRFCRTEYAEPEAHLVRTAAPHPHPHPPPPPGFCPACFPWVLLSVCAYLVDPDPVHNLCQSTLCQLPVHLTLHQEMQLLLYEASQRSSAGGAERPEAGGGLGKTREHGSDSTVPQQSSHVSSLVDRGAGVGSSQVHHFDGAIESL
jgi:hypothetical protein